MIKFSGIFARIVKTKLLLTAIISVLFLGGVAFAAMFTPGGQDVVHPVIATPMPSLRQASKSGLTHGGPVPGVSGTAAAIPQATPDAATYASHSPNQGNNTLQASVKPQSGQGSQLNQSTTPTAAPSASAANSCATSPDVQRLASSFSRQSSGSDGVLAICALHQGTFSGTTVSGSSVSSNHTFSYNDISQLLLYAQLLAGHDHAKLTDTNTRSYLAGALQSCGVSSLSVCLKPNLPTVPTGKLLNNTDQNKAGANKTGVTGTLNNLSLP